MAQVYTDEEGNIWRFAPPTGETGGSTGGGGGGGGSAPTGNDPQQFQGQYGVNIPSNVLTAMTNGWNAQQDPNAAAAEAHRIFLQWYTGNTPDALAAGGGSWWWDGSSKGLYSNWGSYNAWKANIDVAYNQFHGHDASQAEIAGYARAGWTASEVNNLFKGQATVGQLASPLKSMFTPGEIDEMTRGTQHGQELSSFASWMLEAWPTVQASGKTIDRTKAWNAYTSGTRADTFANAMIAGTSATGNPLRPVTRSLFSSDELSEIDQFRAGNITPNGGSLNSFAEFAENIIGTAQYYQQAAPDRATIQSMWNSGLTAEGFGARLRAEGKDPAETKDYTFNRQVIPAAVRSFFTPTELAAIDAGHTDPALTGFANYVYELVDYAQRYNQPIPSRAQIQALYDSGQQPATLASRWSKAENDADQAAAEARAEARQAAAEAAALAKRMATAGAEVKANAPDWNAVSGAQGAPGYQVFDQAAQQAVTNQQAGQGDDQGARWMVEIDKAMQRMKSNFSGVLQNLDRGGYGYLANQRPDVGA